jgi:DNA-binding MarR family transcriptional regulator
MGDRIPTAPSPDRRTQPRDPAASTGRRRAVRRSAPARGVARLPDVRVALDAFRHIVQALRAGRAAGDAGGLGSAQLFALQQIADHPDASINDVAALTCTHQSSVSVVIQRLVRQRLVARIVSSQDRRRQRLVVTARGRRVLDRSPVAVQERLIAAIATLPPAERRALARTLSAVARLVTPDGAAPHPPMFFEDDGRKEPRTRDKKIG